MAVTLATMRNRILNDSERDSSTFSTYVDQKIVAAIKFYERKGRLWFLESNSTSLTLAAAASTTTLPTNFSKLTRVRVLRGGVYISDPDGLEMLSYDELKRRSKDTNITDAPYYCALYGRSTLKFYPTADQEYTLDVDYILKDTSYPSGDADTSVWMDNESEDMIYYKASAGFWGDVLHDEVKRQEFETLAGREWNELIKANNNREYNYWIA